MTTRFNFAFGTVSLLLGMLLLGAAFSRGGLDFNIGVFSGALLLANGILRLWAARLSPRDPKEG